MKIIGIPNLVFTLLISYAIYLSIDIWTSYGFEFSYQNKGLILSILLCLLLLTFFKVIIINTYNIIVIYPFRFYIKKYNLDKLESVYSQKVYGGSTFPFSFNQTYLYFGKDRRIKFSEIEFLNYRKMRDVVVEIEKGDKAKRME